MREERSGGRWCGSVRASGIGQAGCALMQWVRVGGLTFARSGRRSRPLDFADSCVWLSAPGVGSVQVAGSASQIACALELSDNSCVRVGFPLSATFRGKFRVLTHMYLHYANEYQGKLSGNRSGACRPLQIRRRFLHIHSCSGDVGR